MMAGTDRSAMDAFLEEVQKVGLVGRLFSWSKIRKLSYEASNEYALLKSQRDGVTQQVASLDQLLESAKRESEASDREVARLSSELARSQASLEEVRSGLSDRVTRIKELEASAGGNLNQIAEQRAQIVKLLHQIEDKNAEITVYEGKLAEAATARDSIAERVRELEDELESCKSKLDELASTLAARDKRITQFESADAAKQEEHLRKMNEVQGFMAFVILWSLLVYDPVAHWIWGGGWLQALGVLDFAGGITIHITAGVSVLAAVLVLGKRISVTNGVTENPHNIPTVVMGGALLWFGWFGFNGGSALSAGSVAINAVVASQVAAAAAMVVWGLISWLHLGRSSVLGLISGAIAGLAAVTPAAGYVDVSGAMLIGLGAGALCYGGIQVRRRLGFDDALDVWGVHGIAGTFGALMIGLLATSSVNGAVVHNGLLYGGDATLLGAQAIAVAVVWVVSFAITFILLKVIGALTPLRMTKEEERIGADLIQHGETAYN